MPGTCSAPSTSPWTRCAARPATPTSRSCRAASAGAWRSAGCCCRSPTCCCWTSRPTISTPSPSPGWSASCTTIPAPSWPSPTTATSSTTSPAGSWSSIVAAASPGRETIPPGWSRSSSGWCRRRSRSRRASQAKSKARISAYETLLAENADRAAEAGQITIPPGPRLGDLVIEATHLKKGFADRLLIDDLSFKVPPGGIVGVIGPNGAGKTTLFRMITGQDQADGGSLRVGPTVKLGYVDQSRDTLAADKSVWEEISGGLDEIELGKRKVQSRGYVAGFNFKGGDQQKKVGQLSGGERNRVHLAKMLKSGANVLLLDEPTNDLDVDTLRNLEEALLGFAGCVVIISHDRWFLDRIATHMLAFEGDSHVEWFEGNFQDYEKDKMRRLGQDSIIPHRVKYKKLTR